jgi:hypothetical protein
MKALNLRFLGRLAALVAALAGPVGFLLFPAPVAWATSFYEQPFPDSVKDAPVIVHGKVGATFADWGRGEDSNKRIYTYWELQITEVFKGSAEGQQTLRMRELGGEKDGRAMQVAGTANFSLGEDVVVFLSPKNTEGCYDVWGMMMGKFNVQKDESGKEFLRGAGINNLTQGRVSDGDEGHGDTLPKSKWTLERLRSLIASQGDASGMGAAKSAGLPKVTPSNTPGPVASPSPVPTSSLTAPQLQTSPPEDSSSPFGIGFAVGAGALALILFLFFKRRK